MICPVCWASKKVCRHCDGTGQVEDVRLGQFFWLSEFLRSDEARKKKLANAPTEVHVFRMMEFAVNLLDPLRREAGPLFVSSGFRTQKVNTAAGGVKGSAHLYGWAADVAPRNVPPVRILELLDGKMSGYAWDQAILYPSHVHIGFKLPRTEEQRRELRVARGKEFPFWKGASA